MYMPIRLTVFFFLIGILPLTGQIVINEIAVKPNPSASDNCVQSLKDCGASTCGSEYAELYNNSDCPVDIGCYIFISESFDGARDGAFRFPSGTVVPARGFISVGGPNSGASINLFTYCSNNHMLTNNARWYLDNGDAWVALYDASGTLVDAVFWTANAGESAKWPSDSDLDDTPPWIPSATASSCPTVASLSRPAATIGSGANQIEYAGVNPTLGNVLERTVDGGGTWAIGVGTINNCNGACVVVGSCAPLPIELYTYDVTAAEKSVRLEWITQSEVNTDFFKIERSADGEQWMSIGRVEAQGSSQYMVHYTFDDIDAIEGLSYYRLTSIDLDGAVSFKGVRSVEAHNELVVYPNPTKDELFIRNNGELSLGNIFVMDVYGRVIWQFYSEQEELKIETNGWKSGVYYLITGSGKSYCVLKEE